MQFDTMVGMNLVNLNGQQLEVQLITGQGPLAPIVFLHEGLGSVSAWTHRGINWPHEVCSATGRAGVVYSRSGYGHSQAAPGGRNTLQLDYMHREADEVLPALLAQLNVASPVLLGHSDGASLALLYASRHSTSACIAMAPHVVVEPVALAAIAQAKVAFESGDLRSRLARHHADPDGAFWQWNDIWLSSGFASFDIRPQCSHITAPLLLIQGVDDAYGTMAQLDQIALAAPHAHQVRLENCGHSPHRDQPEATLTAITAFLKSIP
jgi:pimeloyl-ACP methyl ester carboxylesterase